MSRLTTGLSPLTVETRDQDLGTFPTDAFEFSPTEKYVGLRTGWGFRTSLLTLSGAGSPFYSPVTGEEAIGEFHPLGRATPSAPDATTTTATTVSPGTLDLSSLVPVGTTWVEVMVSISFNTASEVGHVNGNVWDYDFGAHNGYNTFTKGLSAIHSSRPAMVSSGYVIARAFGKVKIGSSRKLYYGMSIPGETMDIYVRGYYL